MTQPTGHRRSRTVRAAALVTLGLGATACDDAPPTDLPGVAAARLEACRAAHRRLGEDPARCDRLETAIAREQAETRPRFTTVNACETLFGRDACEGETLGTQPPTWRPALAGWARVPGQMTAVQPVVRDRDGTAWALPEANPAGAAGVARQAQPRAVTALDYAATARAPLGVALAYYRLAPAYPEEALCSAEWQSCERFDLPLPTRFATQESCRAHWTNCAEVEIPPEALLVAAAAAAAQPGSAATRSGWGGYNSFWVHRYGSGIGPRYQGWTWTADRQPTPAYRPSTGAGPLRAWDSGSRTLGQANRMGTFVGHDPASVATARARDRVAADLHHHARWLRLDRARLFLGGLSVSDAQCHRTLTARGAAARSAGWRDDVLHETLLTDGQRIFVCAMVAAGLTFFAVGLLVPPRDALFWIGLLLFAAADGPASGACSRSRRAAGPRRPPAGRRRGAAAGRGDLPRRAAGSPVRDVTATSPRCLPCWPSSRARELGHACGGRRPPPGCCSTAATRAWNAPRPTMPRADALARALLDGLVAGLCAGGAEAIRIADAFPPPMRGARDEPFASDPCAAVPDRRLALLLLGGMMVAVGRWNAAETDRAFVEAAARAAALPEATQGRRATGRRFRPPGRRRRRWSRSTGGNSPPRSPRPAPPGLPCPPPGDKPPAAPR
jgi:uncharacterized protein YgiB involved in biofilm formation